MPNTKNGQIITFYSFKGGIGRTMAVANMACLLARMVTHNKMTGPQKARVLAIDWDLEAPGLHRYFRPYLSNMAMNSFDDKPGCLELFAEVDKRRSEYDLNKYSDNRKRSYDFFKNMDFYDYLIETSIPGLALMKAGRYDASYGKRVSELRWDELFFSTVGLFVGFSDFLHEEFDFVIIDSRTGVTDTSGICTMLLPDKLVLVFTHNLQSLTGVKELAIKAVDYRKNSFESRPLIIFPLPSHMETSIPNKIEVWRMGGGTRSLLDLVGLNEEINGYQPFFEHLLCELYGREKVDLKKYFDCAMVKYVPDYAFGEPIAAELELFGTRDFLKESYNNFKELLIELPVPWLSLADVQEEKELLGLCTEAQDNIIGGRIAEAVYGVFAISKIRIHFENLKETVDTMNLVTQKAFPQYREEAIRIIGSVKSIIQDFFCSEIEDKAVTAHLLEETADIALNSCAYDIAQELFNEVVGIYEKELGADNRNTLKTEIKLSTLLIGKGEYFRAKDLIIIAGEKCHKALGEQDPDTLSAEIVLANVYYSIGEYESAEALHRKVLSEREKVLGEGHPDSLASANYLASVLIQKDCYKEADALVSRALEGRLKIYGKEHPETLTSLAYKAILYAYNSNYDQALSLLNDVITVRVKILGEDHPDTITTHFYVADIIIAQRNYSEAIRVLLEVISRRKRVLGDNHPATLSAQKTLAMVYDKTNNTQEAEDILANILPIYRIKLGERHPTIREIESALARITKDLDRIRLKA